ncbi:MAG: hypothetical protein IBX56_08305 [Methylomicrobium sp.]|nr:hypothetical protein [Methylomicrobium sp.]
MKVSLTCLCLIMLMLISGCGYKTRPEGAALHDLGLIVQRNAEQAPLHVEVTAPEWLRDTRIHYRQLYLTPTIVKFYNLDRWIAQPAALLAKHFAAIPVSEPLTVKVRLLDFEQRFDTPQQARSVVAFDVEVYKTNEIAPIARKAFQFEQVNISANALGAVNSFSDLIRKAIIEMTTWLNSLPV